MIHFKRSMYLSKQWRLREKLRYIKCSLLTPFSCAFSSSPHRERKMLLIVFIKFQAALSFSFEQVWRFSFKLKNFQKHNLSNWFFGWKTWRIYFCIGLLCVQFCHNTQSENISSYRWNTGNYHSMFFFPAVLHVTFKYLLTKIGLLLHNTV